MKKLMVIIDGAVGNDYDGLNFLKHLHERGMKNNTPTGFEPDSLCCIMNMLSVNPNDIPSGRAYLEALANGVAVGENDVVFRCNGVLIEKGTLTSSCIERELCGLPKNVEIISLGGYKNLLILRESKKRLEKIKTFAPHNHIGEDINRLLPCCEDLILQDFLREFVLKFNLMPWGQAGKTTFKSFYELKKQTGCVICKTDIVKGIAKALDMHCPEIINATAEIDTDLSAKAEAALELCQKFDFTLLHINGADEAAHRKNHNQKREFIRRIDRDVLCFLQDRMPEDIELVVTSDHATDATTGKHRNESVEYFVFHKKITDG